MSNNLQLTNSQENQNFILFAQHGWADTYRDIGQLAQELAKENPQIITYVPDLGVLNTWLTIAPLIVKVEKIVAEAIAKNPDLPLRIIGHSMGGLIWLEVLARHPEWWQKVHSLVLVASPVGGSDLGRLFDPFRMFPLIARELGTNRRSMAEAIAAQIPTASIVGDIGQNTDGTVPVGCSQFNYATFMRLEGLRHATLKNHHQVAKSIRQFWQNPMISPPQNDIASQLIVKLRALDLTEIDNLNFQYAQVVQTYPNDTKLWKWTNIFQVTHIFVSLQSQDARDQCVYSAYVSWQDNNKLTTILKDLASAM